MFVGKVSGHGTRVRSADADRMRLLPLSFYRSCLCSRGYFHFQGHDHTTFDNVFTPDLPGVKVSRNGWGDFTCARGGIAVWTLASNVAGCV